VRVGGAECWRTTRLNGQPDGPPLLYLFTGPCLIFIADNRNGQLDLIHGGFIAAVSSLVLLPSHYKLAQLFAQIPCHFKRKKSLSERALSGRPPWHAPSKKHWPPFLPCWLFCSWQAGMAAISGRYSRPHSCRVSLSASAKKRGRNIWMPTAVF